MEMSDEVLNSFANIMIASKVSIFKSRDLMALSLDSQDQNADQGLTTFKLSKATREITKIIEMQSNGKKLSLDISYTSDRLKNTHFLGD